MLPATGHWRRAWTGSEFCLDGALLVYRVFEEGRFCFGFDGERFTGHETQYMQAADGR